MCFVNPTEERAAKEKENRAAQDGLRQRNAPVVRSSASIAPSPGSTYQPVQLLSKVDAKTSIGIPLIQSPTAKHGDSFRSLGRCVRVCVCVYGCVGSRVLFGNMPSQQLGTEQYVTIYQFDL